jgi:hypothetical protein
MKEILYESCSVIIDESTDKSGIPVPRLKVLAIAEGFSENTVPNPMGGESHRYYSDKRIASIAKQLDGKGYYLSESDHQDPSSWSKLVGRMENGRVEKIKGKNYAVADVVVLPKTQAMEMYESMKVDPECLGSSLEGSFAESLPENYSFEMVEGKPAAVVGDGFTIENVRAVEHPAAGGKLIAEAKAKDGEKMKITYESLQTDAPELYEAIEKDRKELKELSEARKSGIVELCVAKEAIEALTTERDEMKAKLDTINEAVIEANRVKWITESLPEDINPVIREEITILCKDLDTKEAVEKRAGEHLAYLKRITEAGKPKGMPPADTAITESQNDEDKVAELGRIFTGN